MRHDDTPQAQRAISERTPVRLTLAAQASLIGGAIAMTFAGTLCYADLRHGVEDVRAVNEAQRAEVVQLRNEVSQLRVEVGGLRDELRAERRIRIGSIDEPSARTMP